MADWKKSMQQTFEYYIVDPGTWKNVKPLTNVKSCTINRDLTAATLGSATIDITELVGECYIRVYLVTIQNGVREMHPLGTFLVQTPSSTFDGRVRNVTMDAYTPLIELKENKLPIGYSLREGENIMDRAYQLTREYARAPVVKPSSDKTLPGDFVANEDDTCITYTSDLIANAKFEYSLDELGRILFAPKQDMATLQPVWTYDDDNSSILLPDITMSHDLYGIPNVVEVTYSSGKKCFHSRIVNDDPNSPTSTVNRGREIVYRELNPSMSGAPTQKQLDLYASNLLKELSSVEYTVNYTHGYCPVRIGDCVRLNYTRSGIKNIKAKVISQSIVCEPGCMVSETAVFTTKLWR